MGPMQVLELVRHGYALASSEVVGVVEQCLDLDVVGGQWIPRWALEADSSLAAAGCTSALRRNLFAEGRARVYQALTELVRAGKRPQVLESRRAYARTRLDAPTEAALGAALRDHRAGCFRCGEERQCAEAEDLGAAISLLFPPDRRQAPRP